MARLSPSAVAMADVFASVLDDRGAWYCSAPITTGRRYLTWLLDVGKNFAEIDQADEHFRLHHQSAVVKPNSDHARQVVARLRAQSGMPVIDPTALSPQLGWTQGDWREFWAEVIRRFVSRVIFVDHWEFSNGCAYEFLTAKRKGIATVAENGHTLSRRDGARLIAEASQHIANSGGSSAFLRSILQELEALEIP